MNNGEVRKYRKKVNVNGWMAKYQRWCFGIYTPQFVGYCPFFWFTWLCVLLLPVVLIGKLLEPVGSLAKRIVFLIPSTPRKPRKYDLLGFYKAFLELGSIEAVESTDFLYYDHVIAWIKVTPDWENCCKRLYARFQQEREAVEAETPSQWKKQLVKFFVKYSSWIVRPILVVIGLIICFYAGRLAVIIFSYLTWAILLEALKVAAEIILIGAAAGISISFFVLICRLISRHFSKCPKDPEHVSMFTSGAAAVGDFIIGIFTFITDTVSMLYKKECPLIEWGDKSAPIERNE